MYGGRDGKADELESVTQMNDIKRQKARLEAMKKEAEEERERAREAARERVLREFERGQLGLAATSTVSTSSGLDSSECTFHPSHTARISPFSQLYLMLSTALIHSSGNKAEVRLRRDSGGEAHP